MALLALDNYIFSPEINSDVADFRDWFLTKCEAVDCVIALARAAPRLLQRWDLISQAGRPVFSERAIQFLDPGYFAGRSVLLFDDTIGFGSTMETARALLAERGARVECAAIAVDRDAFLGGGLIGQHLKPSRYFFSLKPDFLVAATNEQLDIMHGLEVRDFASMGKPYMFDFPIYEVNLQPEIKEYTSVLVAKLIGETPANPFLWPSCGDIRHFSIPIDEKFLASLFPKHSDFLKWQGFSKLRIFIDYERRKMRFVPIIQISSTPSSLVGLKDQSLLDPVLRTLVDAVLLHKNTDYHQSFALHRAIVFSLATQIAARVWKGLLRPKLASLFCDENPALCHEDASLLMGAELTGLHPVWMTPT
jgi:hypothetical protein